MQTDSKRQIILAFWSRNLEFRPHQAKLWRLKIQKQGGRIAKGSDVKKISCEAKKEFKSRDKIQD